MTRIHPKHHTLRRRRALTRESLQDQLSRAAQRFANITGYPVADISDMLTKSSVAVHREQQEARMLAKLRALGTDDDTREALIELASSGIPAYRIRDLARSYQRGQTP